ncbi:DHS-like NAD/FAD-binding domain-containing protein [Mytilinidion resinicola]|uniref:DHS-like NAD/FAD-binding domain-containing protein n=1 Tax=Mytilinidion resinicola TaxID=574789 RepID=A0A6A6YBR9_9PEZI|nr:DHS-like NAD/FAD-binding domain-containing protein [Mytilinidion resinicola]KAF2806059.1 DHS-like NAD/FAD-binding domain-containing protein [Mytilinidion resinicola]
MDGANTSDDSAWSTFADFLEASSRVLCLVGAGLSAPSGLATWQDPVTVWSFYGERLLKSLAAQPNAAHHALAALARWHEGWLTINQNVDGLLEQTDHPMSRLLGIHGTLKIVRCTTCDYNTNVHKPHDIPFLLSLSNANNQSRSAALSDLPHCPKYRIDEWISEERIDLVIAAGTSLEVFPAAEWVDTARACGASLAIIDAEKDHRLVDELNDNDWFFKGDIAVILPSILPRILNFSNVDVTQENNIIIDFAGS